MSFNPADDKNILRRIIESDSEELHPCTGTSVPDRWVRCMAAKILQRDDEIEKINNALRKINDYYVKPTTAQETYILCVLDEIRKVLYEPNKL